MEMRPFAVLSDPDSKLLHVNLFPQKKNFTGITSNTTAWIWQRE